MKAQKTIRLGRTVRASDPGYNKNSKGGLTITGFLPGIYKVSATICKCGEWGSRVMKLTIRHESAPRRRPTELAGLCTVDSGQCGFFDRRYFNSHVDDDDYDNPESWYSKICRITTEDKRWGTLDGRCAVSESGYGDGVYDCSVARDAAGNIVAAELNFKNFWEPGSLGHLSR